MKSDEGLFRIKTSLKQAMIIISIFFNFEKLTVFEMDNLNEIEFTQTVKKLLNIEEDKTIIASFKE